MTDTPPLTIVRLTTENIKRISAVTIEPDPDGNLVIISGRNGQGKTSLLDSILLALAGGRKGKETTLPIRQGETRASVEIDFGEFTVLKNWLGDSKPILQVFTKDGATYKSPQEFLNSMLGSLSFDPLAFTRKTPKEQVDDLLAIAPLPFDPLELQAEYDMIFGQRTDVNRTVRNLEGELAGIVIPNEDQIPDEPVSTQSVLDRIAQAQEIANANRVVQVELDDAQRDLERTSAEISKLEARLVVAKDEERKVQEWIVELAKRVSDLPPVPDIDSFRSQLDDAEEINSRVRLKSEKAKTAAKVLQAEAAAKNLSDQLVAIQDRRAQGLKDAGDKMPVVGLGFDESGVTYNGIPFAQCSGAEQLRVSTAMAMALNPKIGVIRITDGSLLDPDNLEVLREMAAEKGHQVWIERVGAGDIGFVIEDGSLVES